MTQFELIKKVENKIESYRKMIGNIKDEIQAINGLELSASNFVIRFREKELDKWKKHFDEALNLERKKIIEELEKKIQMYEAMIHNTRKQFG